MGNVFLHLRKANISVATTTTTMTTAATYAHPERTSFPLKSPVHTACPERRLTARGGAAGDASPSGSYTRESAPPGPLPAPRPLNLPRTPAPQAGSHGHRWGLAV